jgi:hypothetical protein
MIVADFHHSPANGTSSKFAVVRDEIVASYLTLEGIVHGGSYFRARAKLSTHRSSVPTLAGPFALSGLFA